MERAARVRLVLPPHEHDAAGQAGQPERRAVHRCDRVSAAAQPRAGEQRCAASGHRGVARRKNRRQAGWRRAVSIRQAVLALGVAAGASGAQATMPPTNDAPNPYQTITGWAKMPEGRVWGSTSAVAIDKDGVSVWVAERCGTNSCAGSSLDPVLKFDSTGTLVAHFGAGLIVTPHGIFVDRDDNVWVVDCSCTGGGRGRGAPPPGDSTPPKGHQIFKFSPTGKLLMTLGKPGAMGGLLARWHLAC